MKKRNKFDELEEKLEPVKPIYKEATPVPEYETTGIMDKDEWMDMVNQPPLIIGEPSIWGRAKHSLVRGVTFDFLRHFLIGFIGIGGTAVATTGNLGWAIVAGVTGGLVEGGRKVWSGSTASKNGGTKNRLLKAIIELVLAIIEKLLTKRKEARDGD